MAIDDQAAERVKQIKWTKGLGAYLAERKSPPTPEEMRKVIDAMYAEIPVPGDIEVNEVDAGGVRALWVSAPGTSKDRVVVHYHGGAYVVGSPDNYREYGYRLSQAADARVLLGSYRHAPEHPYPAALEDSQTVFRWLANRVDPARIAVSSDSAGAALALGVCIMQRDVGDRLPSALALVSAYINLAADTESYKTNAAVDSSSTREGILSLAQMYLQGRDPELVPLASPVYADISGLPPMYVAVGEYEMLVDDSKLLVERARAAGIEVEFEISAEMQHVYTSWGFLLPEARNTFERIGRFIKRYTPIFD